MDALSEFYASSGPERVGFVLRDGSVVEVENKSPSTEHSSVVDPSFLIDHEDELVASFHTHPGESCNLSTDDLHAFANWPHLKHYVIGKDGIAAFEVRNGNVIRCE